MNDYSYAVEYDMYFQNKNVINYSSSNLLIKWRLFIGKIYDS